MTGMRTASRLPSTPGSNVLVWITASKPFSAAQTTLRIMAGASRTWCRPFNAYFLPWLSEPWHRGNHRRSDIQAACPATRENKLTDSPSTSGGAFRDRGAGSAASVASCSRYVRLSQCAVAMPSRSTGRRLCHGVARSKACATRRTVASSKGFPAIWAASGRPAALKPQLMEIAGFAVTLKTPVMI